MISSSARRMNSQQRERLIDLVERNKDVLYGHKGSAAKFEIWKKIAAVLNKLGSEKTADQWKKTWSDLKSMVKKKAIDLKANNSKQSSIEMQMSEEEYQVLRVRDNQILEDISQMNDNFSFLGKVNTPQRDRLLELVQKNASILCGSNSEERMEKWSMIASTLNSMGYKKTSDQWRKIWLNIMTEVKGKAVSLRAAGTSDHSNEDELSKKDRRLIEIYENEQVEYAQETEDSIPQPAISSKSDNLVRSVPTSQYNGENLQWTNHGKSIVNYQKIYKSEQQTCDVTLAFKGKSVKAHRFILSACSSFFCELLKDVPVGQDATIMVPDLDGYLLDSLLNFIYTGETSVDASKLTEFLDTISILAIKSPISFERANISVSCNKPKNANSDVVVIDPEDDETQKNPTQILPQKVPNEVFILDSIELDNDMKQEILEDYETAEYDALSNKNDENALSEETYSCTILPRQYDVELLDEQPDMDMETDINVDDPIAELESDHYSNSVKKESSDDDDHDDGDGDDHDDGDDDNHDDGDGDDHDDGDEDNYDDGDDDNEDNDDDNYDDNDDDDDYVDVEDKSIRDKAVRLGAEHSKSLMKAYYAHTQKGMTLMNAAVKYNVSRAMLFRKVAMHQKKDNKRNPTRTTRYQFKMMIGFLKANKGVVHGLRSTEDRIKTKVFWNRITKQLNSIGPPQRSWDGWKRVWTDYKYKFKLKLGVNAKYIRDELRSDLEREVISLLDLKTSNDGLESINKKNKGTSSIVVQDDPV